MGNKVQSLLSSNNGKLYMAAGAVAVSAAASIILLRRRNLILTDEDRVLGLFLALAVGDAKGVAYETMSRERVLQIVPQAKETDEDSIEFPACDLNTYMPKGFPAGLYTDDTQQTMCMADALVKGNLSVDIDIVVKEHIAAYNDTIAGWGPTTINAIKKLVDGTHTHENSGNPEATGNGVLMKLAPLALVYSRSNLSKERKIREIEAIARMTHPTPMCFATACTHSFALERVFKNPSQKLISLESRKQFLRDIINDAKHFEELFKQPAEVDKLSDGVSILLKELEEKGELTDETIIAASKGGDSHSAHSLTMTYGLIAQSPLTFRSLTKASLFGGDSDSNAGMIGVVLGYLHGPSVIPPRYLEKLLKKEKIVTCAKQFAAALSK